MADIFYVENSNMVELVGLKNGATDDYINDAVVTLTITDQEEVEVAGQVWPVTLTYTTDSNGDYSVVISPDIELVAGTCYILVIDSDGGSSGLTYHAEVHFIPLERRQ